MKSGIKSYIIDLTMTEKALLFEVCYVLFERYFVQLGAPSGIIYILDFINIYLLLNLCVGNREKKFGGLVLIYLIWVIGSVLIAMVNITSYGNNVGFSVLEVRNIVRFLIFFLAVVKFFRMDHIDNAFKIFEIYFWLNSAFIIYLYFTYFPSDALWMRGDLLNGFFGNSRGGNTFVNVEMLIVVLYLFVKWINRECKLLHFIFALAMSVIVAGMIELKAFFIEIAFVYIWYLLFVKKTKREIELNVIIVFFSIMIMHIAVQIMSKEYPWFADAFSISKLWEAFTSTGYSSTDDLNRFTGMLTISKRMFHGDILEVLFGVGLGNGAASVIAGNTTRFASMWSDSHYSWFQGTYLFVQCGTIGLMLFLSTFIVLYRKKKNSYRVFSNAIILLSIFLVFYGEALKTDAGYLVYFAIATGFTKLTGTHPINCENQNMHYQSKK